MDNNYGRANDPQRISLYDAHEWALDKSVTPHTMVRGAMGKDTGGTWRYLRVSTNGSISNVDAANFRVSAVGVVTTLDPDAASNRVSAFQLDAGDLMVSGRSDDAGLFRVSAVGGTAGDNVIVDGADQAVSARIVQISAAVSSNLNALIVRSTNQNDASDLRTSAFSDDGGLFRVSAIGGTAGDNTLVDGASQSLSATILSASIVRVFTSARPLVTTTIQEDAGLLRVSGIQGDAALFRISAIGTVIVSAHEVKQSDATALRVSAYSDDASKFRVYVVSSSAGGISANQSLSALNLEGTAFIGNVSAKNTDGAYFRVSAIQTTASLLNVTPVQPDAGGCRISAYADDAARFRVSAIGGTAGDNTLVDGETQTVSANLVVSARSVSPTSSMKGLVVAALSPDAQYFRISAIGAVNITQADAAGSRTSCFQTDADDLRISAIQDNATNLNVSAKSNDGGLFRVSALGGLSANQQVSAQLLGGTSFIGFVSATGTLSASQSISARMLEGTAFIGSVSATVSAHEVKQSDANALRISAFSNDGGFLRVSAVQTNASNQMVSARSNDGALFRISAIPMIDAVGRWNVFRSLSLSASQAIKATAGAVYGYYLYNTAPVPNYVKFYNTSGAINIGTDVPILTLMIPASAAANMEYLAGLKGFTAGIGIAALSAVADNATTPAAASAVGGNIFYA